MIHRETVVGLKMKERLKRKKIFVPRRKLYEKKKEEKRFSAGVYEILRTPVAGEEGKK